MEYRHSDSSGTDDDLPPSQPGRPSRGGHVSGNDRAVSGHYRRSSAADQHVRKLEQDAYVGVLRAFRAQSAAITWRKEQVMVTLRQELGITDEEHLEIVRGMDSNNAPSQLRERDEHGGPMYVPNVESYPGATIPVSRKRQKSTHVLQASPVPPIMKSALSPPSLVPTSTGIRAPPVGGSRRQKSRGGRGSAMGARLPSLGDLSAGEVMADPWIGKRGKASWPEDDAFNEAVTDYDPKKLPPSDLQFMDGPPISLSNKGPPRASANLTLGSRGTAGRGSKSKKGGEISGISSPVGRGRSASKGPPDSFERPAQELPSRSWKAPTPENGSDMKGMKHIQFPSLDALVKQVDKIAEEDDLTKVESVRRAAKEHEEMLRKALAEIGDSSEEGDTDEDANRPSLRVHSLERERERSRQHSRDQHDDVDEDDTAGDKEGSDGDRLVGDAS